MIRTGPLLLAVAGCALLCGPAAPQGTQPENEESRFSFFRAADGYLRLDGRTGQVSLCTRRQAGWATIDHEVNQIMGAIENVWRRLVAMIANVQRDLLGKS
jgi:hypothetical protein